MAGLGVALGAAAPVLAAVYAIYKGLQRGPKVVKEQGISGEIVGGDATAQLYQKWKQSGGWIVGDRKGTRYKDLDAATSDALDRSAAGVYGQMEEWSKALGLPAQKLSEITHSISIKLGKDDEETQKNIETAMQGYQEHLASSFATFLEPFQAAGETLVDTLERLVSIDQASRSLNEFGGIFSAIATSSVDAREQLIALAGGIDALMQKAQAFVGTYYSQSEQSGIAARQTVDVLRGLGIDPSAVVTKDDYRHLVEGMDVSTEEGRKTLNALLDLAPTFAQLSDYLVSNGTTLEELAKQAPQIAILTSMFDQAKASADVQVDTVTAVDELNVAVVSSGDNIVTAIGEMKAELTAGLIAIADATAQTTAQLRRWDNQGQLSTTTVAP
jgi:hypothetical protein